MKAAFTPVTLVLFTATPFINADGKISRNDYTEFSRRVVYSEASYKDGVIKAAFALLNGTPIKLYKMRGLGLEEIAIDFVCNKADKITGIVPLLDSDPIDAICAPALADDDCKTFEDLPAISFEEVDPFMAAMENANPNGFILMPPGM